MNAVPPLVLNGRFLTQGVTGVQRFATEIARAADSLAGEGAWPAGTRVIAPSGLEGPSPFRHLALERSPDGLKGQAWEQGALPRAARGAMLVSLGNTAPLLAGRRQAVVIHDAGVFDTPESYSLAFRAWYRALHHALARLGARLLTVSEFSRGRIAHHLGLAPERIGVVPEGGEHILRAPADSTVLARRGLMPGRYALVVGTQAAHKNLAALGEAAWMLAERGMVLAVAGGGAGTGGLFRAGHGASGGARALGRVSDSELRALYESAACLVFPSRYEGFGLPPLEAMACGCPVLAAPSGAVPEVCGDAALWFETAEGTARKLTAALTRLLEEPGLPDRLREAGLARAAAFTWRRAAQALLAHLVPAAAIALTAPEEALPA
jgi:glycosyltransferase involved in cell wall biosynthesis